MFRLQANWIFLKSDILSRLSTLLFSKWSNTICVFRHN